MRSYRKVSVLGGSGFVGTNLCENLANRQIDFEIIDIKESRRFPEKYKKGDVRIKRDLLENITGDVVINLAAVHRDDVRDKNDYFRTNVEGAKNLVEVCLEKDIRKIIFTSSVAVYGFSKVGTDENGSINPFNDYGKTKYQAENVFRQWQKTSGHDLIIVRPTVIFGEGNRGNVFNLLNQIASGKFVMIGSGRNVKSMAYIGDVVSFIGKCLETEKKYAVFNYVDTPDMDMNTLISKVRKELKGKENVGVRLPLLAGLFLGFFADALALILKKKLPVSKIRVKKFCSNTSFSSAKFELDGFQPPFTLEQGIRRTIHSEFVDPSPNREVFFTE